MKWVNRMNKQKEAQPENVKKGSAPEQNNQDKAPEQQPDELAELKDRYVRLAAEFENARKRNERERIEFVKYANEGLISEFLDILDDLERTVQAAKANHHEQDALLKGIEMVMGRIQDMLKRHNVQPIKAVGEKFDPHQHEILMLVDSDEYKEGTIIEEFQKGYRLGDKVVRTAKVKVAKPKASPSAQQTEQTAAEETPEQPPSP
jgi:molecular chaperone GrpE